MTTINRGNSGVAGYSSADYDGPREPLLSNSPPLATESFKTPANGSSSDEIEFELYEVVNVSTAGVLAKVGAAETAPIAGNFRAIMAQKLTIPVSTAVGAVRIVQVYMSGHFDGDALVWSDGIDTDDEKVAAFRPVVSSGPVVPVNIVIGFNKFNRAS